MGKLYHRAKRDLFTISDAGDGALEVVDESEEPTAAWVSAIMSSRGAQPHREKLVELLQTAGPCKQCDLVGLLSHGLELPLTDEGAKLIGHIIKYITRNDMHVKYEKETSVFRKHADKGLARIMCSMRTGELGIEVFWEVWTEHLGWLIPVDAVDRLMAVEGSWGDHDEDIGVVTKTSELGKRMFA